MWRKIAMISRYEARMSSRGWRFWLLLGLLVGISLFARQDYIQRVSDGLFLHPAFSFQHPSFWLMLSILGLGASALALDVCGRLRNSRMDKILFPLPLRPMELMLGRLLGVMIIMIPLSLAGIFSLALWQYIYGHGTVIWQPFWIAFFLLVLPLLFPIAALFITLRTFFKHDFAALLVGSVLGTLIAVQGVRSGIWINVPELIQQFANASPTLGVQWVLGKYGFQLFLHGILSIAFLSLAPLYLRRQEPQRWIIHREGNRLLGFSTLMRFLTDLRFDRHLGWKYRIGLLGILLISTVCVIGAAYHYQELQNRNGLGSKFDEKVQFPSTRVNLIRYALDLQPRSSYDRLDIEAQLNFIPEESTQSLSVELDRIFQIDEAIINEKPCSFERQQNRIRFDFPQDLALNQEQTLTVRYHGLPQDFHFNYSALLCVWYPVPWKKMKTESEQWVAMDDDLFEAEILLHLQNGQKGAFAGNLVDVQELADSRIEQWRSMYPVQSMQIYWGLYDYVESHDFGYRIRFYHLPTHNYQAQVYLEEVKEQEEYIHEKLGELPFPQLTLIETPYTWQAEYVPRKGVREPWIKPTRQTSSTLDPMPGMLPVSENRLCYLHEGMWLMERYDHNPLTIPFYQMIPQVLNEVHEQFYRNLISAYFDHSIHPTGEMAFWVKEYLSSYASKLLEQNMWRRQQELKFDVGSQAHLPLSIARTDSLLALHKAGNYPELERVRGEGLFRMLHLLLGDKTWWAFLRDVFQRYRFQEIPVEDMLPLLETYYGSDLQWFIRDWLYGTSLPEYEITLAEAKIVPDKGRSGVKYETSIKVKNHGTGRMSVPIYLETEMDFVTRDLWLDSGEEKTLSLTVPNRPIFVMVDPENWVVQLPFLDPQKKVRAHSERRITVEGEDDNALRPNRNRGNDRHFWRRH